MRTRIVYLLGMGPLPEPPHYQPCRYADPRLDGALEEPSSLALRLYLDRLGGAGGPSLRVLGTREVQERWVESGLLSSIVPFRPEQFVLLPSGGQETDAAAFVERLLSLLRRERLEDEQEEPERILFDLTHGFRAQSILATSAVQAVLAEDLRAGRPPILELRYAAYEAREQDRAPVWDLTGLVEQQQWLSAIDAFRQHGRADAFAALCESLAKRIIGGGHQDKGRQAERDAVKRLGRCAKSLADALVLLRLEDLVTEHAPAFVQAAEQGGARVAAEGPAVGAALGELVGWAQKMSAPKLETAEGGGALAAVASAAFEMQRYVEALAVLREGTVLQASRAWGCKVKEAEHRLGAEGEPFWTELAGLRNDVLHGGLRRNGQGVDPGKVRKRIPTLIDRFRKRILVSG